MQHAEGYKGQKNDTGMEDDIIKIEMTNGSAYAVCRVSETLLKESTNPVLRHLYLALKRQDGRVTEPDRDITVNFG